MLARHVLAKLHFSKKNKTSPAQTTQYGKEPQQFLQTQKKHLKTHILSYIIHYCILLSYHIHSKNSKTPSNPGVPKTKLLLPHAAGRRLPKANERPRRFMRILFWWGVSCTVEDQQRFFEAECLIVQASLINFWGWGEV